jgi:Amt family ammonium transporter
MTTVPTMAQSLAAPTLISILWVAFGYSLVRRRRPWLGTGPARLSRGHEWRSIAPAIHTSI